ETNTLMRHRRLPVVQPPENVVSIDRRTGTERRLAHPAYGELPIVSGVERRRVEQQDRRFGRPLPVVELRIEVRRFFLWGDVQLVQPPRPGIAIADVRIDVTLEQMAEVHRPGVGRLEDGPKIGPPGRKQSCAQ